MANDKTLYEHRETVYKGKADTVPPGAPTSEDHVTFEKGSLILDTYQVENDPIHDTKAIYAKKTQIMPQIHEIRVRHAAYH